MSDTGPVTLDLLPALATMTTSVGGIRASYELGFTRPNPDEPIFGETLDWMARTRLRSK